MTAGRTSEMTPGVKLAMSAAPSADWDSFVNGAPQRSIYLQSGWAIIAREVFGHTLYFIEARDHAGNLIGVLPIVRQRGLLGDFATSLPFFNYGGALATTATVEVEMMEHAKHAMRELGCAYLELRDVNRKPCDWRIRTDKVSMILELPTTVDALAKKLGSKLRSQIKRADREQVVVKRGGVELLHDFYDVFAENMRDLGTPVYPQRFFEAILRKFPADTAIVVIDIQNKPAAAGFLVFDRTQAEIPWAACRAEAKPLGANMKLYWEVLSLALERSCTKFDFGRSTVGAGTYNFKKQWGAQPLQLHWHRWERNPRPDTSGAHSESWALQQASAIWRRLPLSVANKLGPVLSKSLPW